MIITRYNWFGFLFFAIPASKMYFVQQYGILDDMFDFWSIFAMTAILFILFNSTLRRKLIPKCLRLTIFFILIYIFSTLLNNYDQIFGAISECSRILILPCYLVVCYGRGETAFLAAMKKMHHYFIILLLLDCLTAFFSFVGLINSKMEYSFLGLDNYAAFSIVPMLTIVFLFSFRERGRLRYIDLFIYILCLATKMLTASVTAEIALLVLGIAMLLCIYSKLIVSIIRPWHIIVLFVLLIFATIRFNVQALFEPILISLGKDVTLSYRTVIWSRTLNGISNSLLYGYGATSGDEFKQIVGFSLIWDEQATHPHNFYLAILFRTGLIGSAIYLNMLANVFPKISMLNDKKLIATCVSGLMAFMILGLADDYIMQPYFYILLTLIPMIADLSSYPKK